MCEYLLFTEEKLSDYVLLQNESLILKKKKYKVIENLSNRNTLHCKRGSAMEQVLFNELVISCKWWSRAVLSYEAINGIRDKGK